MLHKNDPDKAIFINFQSARYAESSMDIAQLIYCCADWTTRAKTAPYVIDKELFKNSKEFIKKMDCWYWQNSVNSLLKLPMVSFLLLCYYYVITFLE